MAEPTSDDRDAKTASGHAAPNEVRAPSGLPSGDTSSLLPSSTSSANFLTDASPEGRCLWPGLRRSWFRLASAAALLAAAGSVVSLSAGSKIYGQETEILADQASAQDLV